MLLVDDTKLCLVDDTNMGKIAKNDCEKAVREWPLEQIIKRNSELPVILKWILVTLTTQKLFDSMQPINNKSWVIAVPEVMTDLLDSF